MRKVLEERMATEGSTTQVFITQFTYFTSTKAQILRQKALPDEGKSKVYLLYLHKSTNGDAKAVSRWGGLGHALGRLDALAP